MGYSICVPFDDMHQRDKMMEFLESHFKFWSEIAGEEHDYVRGPVINISYGPSLYDYVIGFDYICSGGPDVEHAHNVCYWMAVKAGMRRKFSDDEIHPFINYDGDEDCPLLINEKRKGWMNVDEIGFRKVNKTILCLFDIKHLALLNIIIKEDLKRLDNFYDNKVS